MQTQKRKRKENKLIFVCRLDYNYWNGFYILTLLPVSPNQLLSNLFDTLYISLSFTVVYFPLRATHTFYNYYIKIQQFFFTLLNIDFTVQTYEEYVKGLFFLIVLFIFIFLSKKIDIYSFLCRY
jgi:hypothetical protein